MTKYLQTTPNIVSFTDYATGVIISDTQVLTAASIFDIKPVTVQVRVGNTFRLSGGYFFENVTYKIHDSYNRVTGENDVAIITINGSFTGLTSVKPIELETSELVGSAQSPINCSIVGCYVDYNLILADYTLSTDAVCAATLNSIVPASLQCASSLTGYGCYMDKGSAVVCNNRLYGIFRLIPECNATTKQPTHSFAKLPASSIRSFIFPKKSYFACPCNTC
ncbi:trypsin alpha-3-like [Anopheles darlingi]|uniref:trypsin alpha-3-like n=1 Tax=Anopheles darlingi TaxID=43151 RepID=UPI0021004FCC|nr:trypsin alpha-3-like [Anopheles darlingi]